MKKAQAFIRGFFLKLLFIRLCILLAYPPLINTMDLTYLIIIEETATGYSAYVPDLPGCITVGSDREEIESNIQEAILLHLEGMQEAGMDIPIPHSQSFTMSVAGTP